MLYYINIYLTDQQVKPDFVSAFTFEGEDVAVASGHDLQLRMADEGIKCEFRTIEGDAKAMTMREVYNSTTSK